MAKFKNIVLGLVLLSTLFLISTAVLKKLYPVLYMDIITEYAAEHNIDPLFVLSIIRAESNFSEGATSHKDAKGLMQLKSDTAKWCAEKMGDDNFSEEEIYTPRANIRIGIWYLSYLLDQFGGDWKLSIAAYNAGMGNVKKWLGNPDYSKDGRSLDKIPFNETQRYTKKVLNNYAIYKMLY